MIITILSAYLGVMAALATAAAIEYKTLKDEHKKH